MLPPQVFGRNLALFVLIAQTPAIQTHHVVWWLFLTWSAVELVRCVALLLL